jgi:hypothetical protein
MKTVFRFTTVTIVLMCALMAQSQAQAVENSADDSPNVVPFNLVEGVGHVGTTASWTGYSTLSVIAGPAILSKTSKTTAFYIGFTSGTTAVVSHMVLYKTLTRSTKITAVTPVTLGGVSDPTIKITSTSVCPSQPVSVTNPCIVRLDPLTLTLSAKDDYYLVIYFTTGTDISSTVGSFSTTALSGWYIGADETQLKVGQALPSGNGGNPPYFLMSVMSN